MIVVAIIGLLAAIAIPNFVRARTTSQKNACINNLRQICGGHAAVGVGQPEGAPGATVTPDGHPAVLEERGCLPGGRPDATFGGSYTLTDCRRRTPVCRIVTDSHMLPPDTTS